MARIVLVGLIGLAISLSAARAKDGKDEVARLTSLQGKSGSDFDKAVVAEQLEVHSNALTLYADYMLLGGNGTLKALAVRKSPIAEAQFKAAQALSGQ